MTSSLWPHGLQPTRLLRLWDFPGKSTGVGCHCLLHQLPEFTQTHVHWVGDAIQTSHPLSSSSPAFNLSHHQGLFKWVLRIRCPKYCSLSFSISLSNEYSGLISFRMDWLVLLAVQGTLRFFSSTTIQKHQFFDAHPSIWSCSHICTWLLEKHTFD